MISHQYFVKLNEKFDVEKLQAEVNTILCSVDYDGEQISLVYRDGYKDKCWTDGAGTAFKFDEQRKPIKDDNGEISRRFRESEFKYINPGLEGTELENIYETCKKLYNISRFRIAKINPKNCYGWHKDEEIRIHVPVFTSPGCFIVTDDGLATHLPADGSAYVFYARNGYHTAVNSDYNLERIHLLLNIC
jgi:hypothetical protein